MEQINKKYSHQPSFFLSNYKMIKLIFIFFFSLLIIFTTKSYYDIIRVLCNKKGTSHLSTFSSLTNYQAFEQNETPLNINIFLLITQIT